MYRALSVELLVLCASVGLGLVHIVVASHYASLQRGYRWTASARDGEVPPLKGVAGRLARALDNFSETFPYFAALALAIEITGRHSDLSEWGLHRLSRRPRIVFAAIHLRHSGCSLTRLERRHLRCHRASCWFAHRLSRAAIATGA